jgi:pimeloyl-ACP methyl ester carboxylesterase
VHWKIHENQETGQYEALVRQHVGLVHDYVCRQTDFRDTWEDLDVPTLVLRASETESNLSDHEWQLMKELRRGKHSSNKFVVVHDAEHGVHRSHPDQWVEIVSSFVLSA